jgi:hypothetical protein
MLNAGTLTFEEFAMREELPLATIHEAVLDLTMLELPEIGVSALRLEFIAWVR